VSDTKVYSGLTAVMQALDARAPAKPRPAPRWSKVTLAKLSAVEDLLDWLENNGYDERSVDLSGDAFVVRWR
jgi:hypothetical protein